MRTFSLILALSLLATELVAQTVVVTLSPNSPPERNWARYEPFEYAFAAFRFQASGGAVQLDGITLTVSGTGDFSTDFAAGNGIQAWQDDGDGSFSDTTDTQLAAASGSSPTIALNFSSSVSIADGTSADVWIVGAFLGNSKGKNYAVAISSTGDVDAPGSTVTLGSPAPISALVGIASGKGSGATGGNVKCVAESRAGPPGILFLTFAGFLLVRWIGKNGNGVRLLFFALRSWHTPC